MIEHAHKMGSPSLRIGSVRLDGQAWLAPMSGVTDVGMRRIARRFGASAVVSEMVASDEFIQGSTEARLRAEGEGVDPHIVQIVGCEPGPMAEAARLAEASGASVIDINMGCPAKRVTGGACGSALMRVPDLALQLIEATVRAVRVPVTVKMRLGWDTTSLNAADLARAAEQAGVALVTVHGRTRQQFYKGEADWSAIAAVTAAVTIPVVANGDCRTASHAREMLERSGASGVMIGRAAVGRPWLVGQIARELAGGDVAQEPSARDKAEAALEHLDALLGQMGEHSGLRHARKHLVAYADHAGGPATPARARDRLRLVTSDNAGEVSRLLAAVFENSGACEAA